MGVRRSAWALILFSTMACSSSTTTTPPPLDGGLVAGEDGGLVGSADGGMVGGEDGGRVAGDLCNGVTTRGRCVDANTWQDCVVVTERADPRLVTIACVSGEACQVNNGKAECTLTAACRNGDTECTDNGANVRTCTNNAWVPTTCTGGCVAVGVSAVCSSGIPTTDVTARVVYQRRTINDAHAALGDVSEAPARGFLVTVQRGTTVVASTKTSITDGTFTVKLPSALEGTDTVKVVALAEDGNNGVAYFIANPGFQAGQRDEATVSGVTAPTVWSFEFPATALQGGSPVLRITETGHASGIATVFDRFGVTYRDMQARFGRRGAPIVIWMGAGVAWKCGACVGDQPSVYFGTRFTQAMWYPADNDRSYYSDPVIGHEAGHWVMSAYGRSPGEGGGHSVSCKSFPGLAWSDGFGTWLGNYAAGSPVYFDIQEGGLFWYDIAARTYNGNASGWPMRPTPNDPDLLPSTAPGLLQKLSEGEVTAILWSLSNGVADPQPILAALATPRMMQPVNVGGVDMFERGYVRHDWDFVQATCTDNNVRKLNEPAPILPDLLDAMMCAGFPRDRMDAATVPTTFYPYPSGTPLCRN